jgi:hypothetical protein
MQESIDSLSRRLRRLERINLALVAGIAWIAIGTVLLGARQAPLEEIRAQRIQIVDGQGRVRIDLRHDETETGMFILDENGDTRLGAAQFAHGGGGYALHGPGGRGAAVLYLKGGGSLTLYDEDGGVVSRFPEASR